MSTEVCPPQEQSTQESLCALQGHAEQQSQDAVDQAAYEEMAEEFNAEAARRRPALRRRISSLHAD